MHLMDYNELIVIDDIFMDLRSETVGNNYQSGIVKIPPINMLMTWGRFQPPFVISNPKLFISTVQQVQAMITHCFKGPLNIYF